MAFLADRLAMQANQYATMQDQIPRFDSIGTVEMDFSDNQKSIQLNDEMVFDDSNLNKTKLSVSLDRGKKVYDSPEA